MKFKFFITNFFIVIVFIIKAQDLPKYTVDLDNEMHYKVNPNNWQERGIKEFQEDILILFKNNDFLKNKSSINVFYEIEFNQFGNSRLTLLGTTLPYEEYLLEEHIKKEIVKFVKDFKPARYKGKTISKKYLIQFTVYEKNNLVSIHNIVFDPTLSFDKPSVDCFTIYGKTKSNFLTEPIFLATNIAPEYRGGTKFLCFILNRKLKEFYHEQESQSLIKRDSVEIPFIVSKEGKLGFSDSYQPMSSIESEILCLMGTTACDWESSIHESRRLNYGLRLRFVYEYMVEKENNTKKLIKVAKIKNEKAYKSDFRDLYVE